MRGLRQLLTALVVFVALVFANEASAGDILRRTAGSWFYGPETVWSSGTTTAPGKFFPLSDPMPSGGLLGARFSYQMTNDAGQCELRAAVRFSDDGVTWGTHKEVNATWSDNTPADEIIYGSAYVDLMALGVTPGAWIQFGVETLNRSGSTIWNCSATLRVEPKERQ